ncbi:MAG: glycosyltransferase [Bryobacterales bacterium]|jgi:glycosyltransferase involved in cell wall biosynthesis|nr:glycosyltransferase [Bryobacterales bacterium]
MKRRVLVFIVAYNAEKTIESVLRRIPASLLEKYAVDVLVIDDASRDATFEISHQLAAVEDLPFKIVTLINPVNQGYGGNQKIGYHYALQQGYDFVALLHGDGQYAPECLPALLEPLRTGQADAVFGSRMLRKSEALRGGMPLYKYVGNKILTRLENWLLKSNLSEFHSGYRIYSTRGLAAIPFDRNTNDFHFDTEIIIQLLVAGLKITELPIPTYYGDEICHVNGLRYAFNVAKSVLQSRMQQMGLFFDPKFDCGGPNLSPYLPKFEYTSPHSLALERIPNKAEVLDLGCAGGYMGAALATRKQCRVIGVDNFPTDHEKLHEFFLHDLNDGPPAINYDRVQYVLLLDVLEHLSRPEEFLEDLRRRLALNPTCEIIVSTANVAFFSSRIMLFLGQFNYGKRGILDLTHTRLFTFSSFRRSITQSGFTVVETLGVPGPFPLALGDNRLSRLLLSLNSILINLSRGLFSYQIFMRIKPQPMLESLLANAHEQSAIKARELAATAKASS